MPAGELPLGHFCGGAICERASYRNLEQAYWWRFSTFSLTVRREDLDHYLDDSSARTQMLSRSRGFSARCIRHVVRIAAVVQKRREPTKLRQGHISCVGRPRTTCVARSPATCSVQVYPSLTRSMSPKKRSPEPSSTGDIAKCSSSTRPARRYC